MAEALISTIFPPNTVSQNTTKSSSANSDQFNSANTKAPSTANQKTKQPSEFERALAGDTIKTNEKSLTKQKQTKPAVKAERLDKKSDTDNPKSSRSDAPSKQSKQSSNNRQSLQPLKKAATNNKNAVESSPVVALLTGRLDRVNPEKIPELVSSNSFVSSAMSHEAIESFLDQPVPVQDFLQNLDVPSAILDEAEELGLDPYAIISPNEILRALGVDPQRVFAELKQLKDSMPLEGLQSYVQRAMALQKSLGSDAATNPDHLSREKLNRDAEAAKSIAQNLPKQSIGTISLNQSQNSPQSIQVIDQSSAQRAQYNLPNNTNEQQSPNTLLTSSQQQALLQFSPTQTPTNLIDSTNLAASENSANIMKLIANAALLDEGRNSNIDQINQSISENLSANSTTIGTSALANSQQSSPMLLKAASSDKFAELGRNFDPEKTTKWTTSDESSSADLSPQQIGKKNQSVELEQLLIQLSNQEEYSNSRLQSKDDSMQFIKEKIIDIGSNQKSEEYQPTLSKDMQPISLKSAQDILYGNSTIAKASQNTNSTLSELSESLIKENEINLGPLETNNDKKIDLSAKEQSSSNQENLSDQASRSEFINISNPTKKNENLNKFSAELSNINNQSPSFERSPTMQQIFERASFLARDGGGIINLDINSPEIGQIELAVNINNDRLDLRIITENEKARDIISAEINQLRDSLITQNLQLGSAEVGVGRRDQSQSNNLLGAFQQQAAQRQFGDGESRRERARNWQNDVEQQTRNLTRSITQPETISSNYKQPSALPNIDGQINIRA